MSHWRTNIGGAVSVMGTSLIGIGVLPQLSQLSPTTVSILTPHQLAFLWYTAFVGFILSGIGKGLTALFAADARKVQDIQDQVNQNESTAVDSKKDQP